jgi:hypothetical protein
MDTFVLETNGRLIFTNQARVIRAHDEVSTDLAAATNFEIEKSNPFLKWIVGDFVEADNPNTNTQFWTKDDLALGEYSIKYSPLNMLHKQTTPVGFFLSTRTIDLNGAAGRDSAAQGTAKIEALSAMWSHVFPFEAALVDQADEMGSLFYSMECRGTHVHCAGPNGCDQSFDYMDVENHCAHLKERSSVRHIVNPTFRGGALIIPPTKPGWKNASARVMEDAQIREQAAKYAELTEVSFNQANAGGADLSVAAWEQLMGQIVSYGRPLN